MKRIKNTLNSLQITAAIILGAAGAEVMNGTLAFLLAIAIAYHGMLSLIKRNRPDWLVFTESESETE